MDMVCSRYYKGLYQGPLHQGCHENTEGLASFAADSHPRKSLARMSRNTEICLTKTNRPYSFSQKSSQVNSGPGRFIPTILCIFMLREPNRYCQVMLLRFVIARSYRSIH